MPIANTEHKSHEGSVRRGKDYYAARISMKSQGKYLWKHILLHKTIKLQNVLLFASDAK